MLVPKMDEVYGVVLVSITLPFVVSICIATLKFFFPLKSRGVWVPPVHRAALHESSSRVNWPGQTAVVPGRSMANSFFGSAASKLFFLRIL